MASVIFGIIISSMIGWEIKNGAIVGGIVGVFYVVLAGIKEVGWANLVNAVVMYIGLILATIFLAFRLSGTTNPWPIFTPARAATLC